jgi:hypothetical protein
MEGFIIFDVRFYEINVDGFRVINTSNVGDYVVKDEPPQLPAYFGLKCPRGHGECNYLRIKGGPADDGKHPVWKWNGDRVAPTITPSINCLAHKPDDPSVKYAGCGWHGYITNGHTVG